MTARAKPKEKPMAIDLRKDTKTVSAYLKERVKEYPIYENNGPGDDDDPISMITLGFDFDQSCWIALVFDTREETEPDGEWNDYIDDVDPVEFERWFDRPGKITLHDGTVKKIKRDFEAEDVASYFGAMLREELISARDSGVFSTLPTTDDCVLVVEHSDGAYGANDYLDGRDPIPTEEDDEDIFAAKRNVAKKLPVTKQISFWLSDLEDMAIGKITGSYGYFGQEYSVNALKEIGDKALIPMLKLCTKLTKHPEFGNDSNSNRWRVVVNILEEVESMGPATPSAKRLLLEIVKDGGRAKKAVVQVFAASCLNVLFDYPVPIRSRRTGRDRLDNADDFV